MTSQWICSVTPSFTGVAPATPNLLQASSSLDSLVIAFPCGVASPLLLFALIADLGSSRVILLNNRKWRLAHASCLPTTRQLLKKASRGLQGLGDAAVICPLILSLSLQSHTPCREQRKGLYVQTHW